MSERYLSILIKEIESLGYHYYPYETLQIQNYYLKDDRIRFEEAVCNQQSMFIKLCKYSDNWKALIRQEIKSLLIFQEYKNQIVQFLGITSLQFLEYNAQEREEELWIGIILEKAPYGSLASYIQQNPLTNYERRLTWCLQLCQQINLLHQKHYIHRDIKPDNLLLFEDNRIKLCDFELTQKLADELITTTYKGTPHFSAPETFRNRLMINATQEKCTGLHTFGSDVYSIGISMVQILTGVIPNLIGSKDMYIKQSLQNTSIIPTNQQKQSLEILLLQCIDDSPTKRLVVSELEIKFQEMIQEENIRLFQLQNNLISQDEIQFISWALKDNNHSMHYLNFFHINFLSQQNHINMFELACHEGKIIPIRFYLKSLGNNTNEITKSISYGLITASKLDKLEVVKELLHSDYQVYVNKSLLFEIFFINCEKGHLLILQYLIQTQEVIAQNITHKDQNGYNGLILACKAGQLDIVQYLIENPFAAIKDIFLENKNGNNGFMIACIYGHMNIIQYFLTMNNEIIQRLYSHKNVFGENVFLLACQEGHVHIIQYLLENPSLPYRDITCINEFGDNAFIKTCSNGHLPLLKYLFENTIITSSSLNISDSNKDGYNALMKACCSGHLDIIKYILETEHSHQIDLSAVNWNGDNVLMLSCYYNYLEIAQYFIENHSFHLEAINEDGENIYQIALKQENTDIIDYLLKITNSSEKLLYQ